MTTEQKRSHTTFICADEVAEDGTVSLAFTHASDYVTAVDGDEEEESGTGTVFAVKKKGKDTNSGQ